MIFGRFFNFNFFYFYFYFFTTKKFSRKFIQPIFCKNGRFFAKTGFKKLKNNGSRFRPGHKREAANDCPPRHSRQTKKNKKNHNITNTTLKWPKQFDRTLKSPMNLRKDIRLVTQISLTHLGIIIHFYLGNRPTTNS